MRLPIGVDTLRAMTDEFSKISMDAGARATLAGKQGLGRTYLVGGELPSNDPTETNFVAKIAQDPPSPPPLKEKAISLASKAKDPTVAALKGAGGGILLGQLITGGRLGQANAFTRLGYRSFGALGAGAGLANHFGALDKIKNLKEKTANMISSTFTPARELSEGVQTGSFKKMIHSGGRLRPLKVGQKFSVPSEPL